MNPAHTVTPSNFSHIKNAISNQGILQGQHGKLFKTLAESNQVLLNQVSLLIDWVTALTTFGGLQSASSSRSPPAFTSSCLISGSRHCFSLLWASCYCSIWWTSWLMWRLFDSVFPSALIAAFLECLWPLLHSLPDLVITGFQQCGRVSKSCVSIMMQRCKQGAKYLLSLW